MADSSGTGTPAPALVPSLRLATRGSALAVRQTELVAEALQSAHAGLVIEQVIVRTEGDANQQTPVSQLGDGAWVRGVEGALLSGRADVAVHSLKDMPSTETAGLLLAAFPARGDVRDVLVSRDGRGFAELPLGARLGTGSPRRATIARSLRPDLAVAGIRGNVDTRLRKLDAGDYDAIVLAAAGLIRMGWQERVTEYLDPAVWTPAAGQGALGVQCRGGDPAEPLLTMIDHAGTHAAVIAERAALRRLTAGCHVPLGVYGRVVAGELWLSGLLLSLDGRERVTAECHGPPADSEALGRALGDALLAKGAHLLG